MDLALILLNSLVAAILALFGLAFLSAPLAFHRWPWLQLFGLILRVLPAPPLLFSSSSWVNVTDLLLAALMVALAVGIAKSQRLAYFTYSLVCLFTILSRLSEIWSFFAPSHFSFMPTAGRYVALDSMGIVLALVAAWCAHFRASSSPRWQADEDKKSQTFPESIPWATLVLALLALLLFVARSASIFDRISGDQVRYETFRLVLVALAYASILAFGSRRSTRTYAASLAVGVSVTTVLTLILQAGSPFALFVMLVFWSAAAGPGQLGAPLVQAAFVLSNFALIFVSLASLIHRRNFHAGFVALAAILIGAIEPAVHTLQQHDARLYTLAHQLATGGPYILYRTESCLLRFKAEHRPATFPDSLRQLDKSLPGCLQDGLSTGEEIGGYHIKYHASGAAPIERFSLIASPSVHYAGSIVSFFSDETGVLRTYSGNRIAVASDGGVTPAADLLSIRNCVLNFTSFSDKRNTGWSEVNRAYDADQMRYPLSFEDMAAEKRCSIPSRQDAASRTNAAYRFTYRRVVRDGIENFSLLARPIQYGVSGLRSYFIDDTSVIHATSENRDATIDDPWAYRCEFASLGTPCVDETPRTQLASEDDLPKDDSAYKPEHPGSHTGGLASTNSAQLFWRFNKQFITFVGVSSDLQRVFMKIADKGVIVALSQDEKPLWILKAAQSVLVANGSAYLVNENDGILSGVDADGKVLWSFNYFFRGVPVRSSEGVIYAFAGAGLYAISDGGEMLWRMRLPDYGGSGGVISEDQQVLYVVSDRKLHAVDVKKGKLLWSVDNACYDAADVCRPMLLANGSIVIPSDEVKGTKLRSILRLLDSSGKTIWTMKYPETIEYVVPSHTNTIVVSSQGALQALDARGAPEWSSSKYWSTLTESRRAGFFYACFNDTESLVDSQGQHNLVSPSETPWAGLCGSVHEASNNLLFIEERPSTLWTIRLPDPPPAGPVHTAR